MRDVVLELRSIGEGGTDSLTHSSGGSKWLAVAAAVLADRRGGCACGRRGASTKPVDRPLVRLDVDLGADVSLPDSLQCGAALPSLPMGRGLSTHPAGRRSCSPGGWINRKPPNSRERRGPPAPFFSPDGQWIGFFAGGKLNKISVEGGAVVPLGDVDGIFDGASWGEDGSIVVSHATPRACCGFPPVEARPRQSRNWPTENSPSLSRRFCPEAKRSCFRLEHGRGRGYTHHRGPHAGGSPQEDRGPRWRIPPVSGHIERGWAIWSTSTRQRCSRSRSIWTSWRRAGRPCPFWTMSPMRADSEPVNLTSPRTGTLVYRRASGGASAMMTLQWVDPAGKKEPLRAKPGDLSDR